MTDNTIKRIGEFELIDHGIEHSQCFSGYGAVSTRFTNDVLGSGHNPAEAIFDCLEQIAQAGFDTEGMEVRILKQEGWEKLPQKPSACDVCDSWDDNSYCLHCQYCYHISIHWNEGS